MRWWPRCRSGRRRRAAQSGGLADAGRQAPCARRRPPRDAGPRKQEEIGATTTSKARHGDARSRCGARRRCRRRSAPADLHRLPSGALDRGAAGADAAADRRADDRGDRAGLPGPASRRSRSASCAPRRHWPRPGLPFEVPRGAELASAARLGAGGDLPDLQRGLCRDRGPGLVRPALCEEALRLGRILAGAMPAGARGASAWSR